MASTYSPSLKIELIGTGDQSGTWGTTTNNNLGTLVEQAITGVQSITMVNADYTLTNYNGVSDEARNAVLVVSGTNSAIRKVVAPLVNKIYVITNNTSGGYAITIGASTGSIVTIPNGVTAQVYCDGTNFYSAQTGSAGNFTINGTLTATGLTDTGNMSVAGNAAVTGTLDVTGATTFVGIPSGPTATAGTNTTQLATTAFVTTAVGTVGTMASQNANAVAITGGTVNNTTIGATTQNTGKFTTLEATSTFTLNGASSGTLVLAPNATAGTNTVTFPVGTGTAVVNNVNSAIVSSTAQASTSGTSIDFTSIPSWVKRITVMFNAVSTSSNSPVLVQLGDSGGIENTSYTAHGAVIQNGSVASTDYTTGFGLSNDGSAAYSASGSFTLCNLSGNIWVLSGSARQATNRLAFAGGSKTLSATLDRVRITTVNGTDTFDAGSINILYE